ncbi:MAG: UPF0236 family protein [Clostridia bacterium]|nr:UPF0236 family protein [Clostridia bacterium]
MFENILTKESVSFKDLEEIAFKIACELANEILRNMLEEYDKALMNTRDTKVYRHKGKETTTIKAKTGLVEYTRTKYLIKDENGKNRCVYLTDQLLNIKEMGQVSSGIIELIVKNISEVSYRVCAEMINNMTGLSISGVAVWNIVQQLGEEIKQYEQEKVEAFQEDKLKAGEKETPIIYQEADGIMIYTQGEDRKKQIEKYKEEHPNEEVPKKVRNIELKLGMTYEGWKEVGKNRYAIVGKEYVAGYMSGEEMANITNANLYSKYDMSKVEIRVLNSDGGSWIKKLLTAKAIYQADSYHLKEKISSHVRDTEDIEILKNMFYKREYLKMINYVETLKYKYDGEVEEVEKLNELQRYLNKRKDTMKRYKDYDGVKQKLRTYSKKTGLKYRNMGCQESNNYCKLTRRMKKKRMSWSKNGSENIAKVITMYASESCTDIIRDLNIQILPESYIEYAQKYIEEIENNIKELKKNKVKEKKVYTFKQGSLEGYPNLKKILENKSISELIYR